MLTHQELIDLFVEALEIKGSHHKQWYLCEIAEAIGIKQTLEKIAEIKQLEKGIAP